MKQNTTRITSRKENSAVMQETLTLLFQTSEVENTSKDTDNLFIQIKKLKKIDFLELLNSEYTFFQIYI